MILAEAVRLIGKFTKVEGNFHRVMLIGPQEDRHDVFDALALAGYSVRESGPYCDSGMFPKVDSSLFKIVAERKEVSA